MGAPAPSDPLAVAAAVRARHLELGGLLRTLSESDLLAPSHLPGWSRLTIVCHLRYGAETTAVMTDAALAGRPAAFYPSGPATQRDETLHPRPGERPEDVVRSFAAASSQLDERWRALSTLAWSTVVREPEGDVDLGETSIAALALLRSTEVEVHGTDLDIGASAWSRSFVSEALPFRVRWLPARRSNHRAAEASVNGRWVLAPTDGPTWVVSAHDDIVTIDERNDGEPDVDVRVAGSQHDLLAFLLGRVGLDALTIDGDEQLAHQFARAFPAP